MLHSQRKYDRIIICLYRSLLAQLPIGRSARSDHLRLCAADDRHLDDSGQPRAGVEIEAETLDLMLMRRVMPRVVRGVTVDDEEAAKTLPPRPIFEEGPAHPGPVALLDEPGQRRVPGN